MTDMQQRLTTQLQASFRPTHLEVINESHQHSGANQQSHFKLVVVSNNFAGVKLIDRHRLINKLFAEELTQIHAMALHTYTPEEWQDKNSAPDSPLCASKS